MHKMVTKAYYQESELIKLLYALVNCLIELYDHNIKPFFISLDSIVSSNNKFKLIDMDLANSMNPVDCLNYKS